MTRILLVLFTMFLSFSVFAEGGGITDKGLMYLAGVFGVGIAAIGGTFGQSRAAAAALKGIARNPSAADKIFTPMILSLAFMESLVIFTLLSIFLVK